MSTLRELGDGGSGCRAEGYQMAEPNEVSVPAAEAGPDRVMFDLEVGAAVRTTQHEQTGRHHFLLDSDVHVPTSGDC
jgi:hypothetical protein